MRDMHLVDTDEEEPMVRLFNQGVILGEDSEKMSKSRGNVINPDDLIKSYGVDSLRLYLMFISRWDQGAPWNSASMEGVPRFINRVWTLVVEDPKKGGSKEGQDELLEIQRLTHQTIRKVSGDIETFDFNTAIAALMTFSNALNKAKCKRTVETEIWEQGIRSLILLLAPSPRN